MVRLVHEQTKDFFKLIYQEERVQRYLSLLRKHHRETYAHSARVGLLSIDLGYDSQFSEYELKLVGYSGLLHDIGKIRIPKEILSKESRLQADDMAVVQGHSRLGFLELHGLEHGLVQKIVTAHHEFKTSPYPRSGKDRRRAQRSKRERRGNHKRIYTLAQITAIADISDALASRRSYKPPLPKEEIKEVLRKQFTGDKIYIEQILQRL